MTLNIPAPPETNWDKVDPDIGYQGSQITLPNSPVKMPIARAIETLQRKQKDEETILQAVEIIDAHPMDAAVAFMKAMKQIYGWASPVPTMTFFGPKPPALITVKTGPFYEDSVQVLIGQFKLPNIENPVAVTPQDIEGRQQFLITCQVRKREQYIIKDLANKTREILKAESIYKGKAIRLKVTGNGNISAEPPTFLHTNYISPRDLILNDGEAAQVGIALWTPIQHTKACLANRIPLKRGILLEGPYGCGKTMTANVTAKVCVENGWTFILLDNCAALQDALLLANRYAPAVVFAEDIDRVTEDRDERGNDLLNTIDGILSKDAQVITVLTTNFVEKIDKAMLRPGRLDAVISIKAPNANAVQQLIRLYARNLLPADAKLETVGTTLADNIPATIREVVERAKLGMISRGDTFISAGDLLHAANGMSNHLRLLSEKPLGETPADVLYKALRGVANPLENGLAKDFEQLEGAVGCTHNKADEAVTRVRIVQEKVNDMEDAIGDIHEAVGEIRKAVVDN